MVGAPLREVGAPMPPGESPLRGAIKSGKVAPWGQQPGGAAQLQAFKGDGSVAKVDDLLEKGILKGKESSGGLYG